MPDQTLQFWTAIVNVVVGYGQEVVDAIKSFAKTQLTAEEYVQLEQAWQEDVDRTAKNAGLQP